MSKAVELVTKRIETYESVLSGIYELIDLLGERQYLTERKMEVITQLCTLRAIVTELIKAGA